MVESTYAKASADNVGYQADLFLMVRNSEAWLAKDLICYIFISAKFWEICEKLMLESLPKRNSTFQD